MPLDDELTGATLRPIRTKPGAMPPPGARRRLPAAALDAAGSGQQRKRAGPRRRGRRTRAPGFIDGCVAVSLLATGIATASALSSVCESDEYCEFRGLSEYAFLDYEPKIPSVPTAITFAIRIPPEFFVPEDREIELHLPGFMSASCSSPCPARSIPLVDSLHLDSLTATWSETEQKVRVRVPAYVGNNSVRATIPMSADLMLPRTGVKKNQVDLKIGLAIFQSPAVGSFLPDALGGQETEIMYVASGGGDVLAGQLIDLFINFQHHMRIGVGESITLTLPYFNGRSFSETAYTEGSTDLVASWVADTFKLTLECQGTALEPGIRTDIVVRSHLRVASDGVSLNDPALTIESDAVSGPVQPTPIVSSPEVSGVVTTSSLSFCDGECTFNGFEWLCTTKRARPGHSAEIVLALELAIDIRAGETVVLSLPGFRGPVSGRTIPVSGQPLCELGPSTATSTWTLGNPPLMANIRYLEQHPYGCTSNPACQALSYIGSSLLSSASWSDTTQQLTLTAAGILSGGETHIATIPMHAGIILPDTGIRETDTDFRFESGLIEDNRRIPEIPPQLLFSVGAIRNAGLSFTPSLPGRPADVEFSFNTIYSLLVGDILNLTLHDFDFDALSAGAFSISSAPVAFSAVAICYDAPCGSKILSLTCTQEVPSGTPVQIVFDRSLGVMLPLEGVAPTAGKYLYSLQATHGWIPNSNFVHIQPVPAVFDSTKLSYTGTTGNGFSEVHFTYTARRPLAIDDVISIHLRQFSGESSDALSAVSAYAYQSADSSWQPLSSLVKRYTWQPAHESLQIVLGAAVVVDQTIQIRFQELAKIALPVFGMIANSTELTIRATFVDGTSMLEIPVDVSPQVLAVLEDAFLDFGPVRANASSILILRVVPRFDLARGDTISVTLPEFHFTASSPSVSSAIDFSADFDQATWAGNIITFTVSRTITNGTEARVSLTEEAGIFMALVGVGVASRLTIAGTVQSMGAPGQFYPTAIPQVQRVGALRGTARLVFGGTDPGVTQPTAGAVTSVDLYFSAYMDLFPGDTVTLHLQGFGGVSTGREDIISEPLNAVRRASWHPSSESLVFTVGSVTPISASTMIRATFPTDILTVPTDGLAACIDVSSTHCPVHISVNATQANILEAPQTWVTEYAPIGKLGFSSLRFTPARPGVLVDIDFTFRLLRPLRVGDTVTTSFTAFGVRKTASNEYVLNGVATSSISGDSIFDQVQIIDSSTAVKCIFTAVREAGPLIPQIIRIPKAAGISIPERGIPAGDNILLQVDSIASSEGSISGEPIREVERVGAVLDVNFELTPASAGYITEFTIDLTPTMIMHPGDFINFFIPGFTGPPMSTAPIMCRKWNESTQVYDLTGFIREATWTQESESFNLTVVQMIPPDTRLQLMVFRDSRIAVPGSGISANMRTRQMFVSTTSVDGRLEHEPIPTSTVIQAVLGKRDLTVEPKQALVPVDLKIVLQVRATMNRDATIMLYMPGFSGGRDCWDALPGDPRMELRCLTADRGESCGPYLTFQCPSDVERYCLPFSPFLNAFSKKPFGGCSFKPNIYLGPHSLEGFPKKVGSCACLTGEEYTEAYDKIWQYWNTSGHMVGSRTLPSHYGSQCWPWDALVCEKNSPQDQCGLGEQRTAVACDKLFPGADGPHCCSSFCFVSAECGSSVKWHGYSNSFSSQDTTFISYDTCNDHAETVETCPYAFAQEGRDDVASASWTEYDQYLVLTLKKPIIAFTPVIVNVPAEQRIITPEEGFGPSFSTLTVDIWDPTSNTRLNPIDVSILDAIGSFHNATFELQDFRPGEAVAFSVRFTPLMSIAPGEIVSVVLSGFETGKTSISIRSDPPNFLLSTWDAQLETLDMVVSRSIARDDEIVVYIPSELRLPVTGLTSSSVISLVTNARQGQVGRQNPSRVQILQTVGALWNTVVIFDPPTFDEAINITFEFRSRMEIVTGDTVTLTLEGFTGPLCPGVDCPGQSQMYIASLLNEPVERFVLAWRNDGKSPPTITMIINQKTILPADTSFRTVIPGNCTFLNEFQQCSSVLGIMRPQLQKDYDPKGLYLSVQAKAGKVDKSFVRVSSLFSTRPSINVLQGMWKGLSYYSSGFVQEAELTHLMDCLSSGFECPSQGAYRCHTMSSVSEFTVSGNQARFKTAPSEIRNEETGRTFDGSNRGGDFTLISMVGNELLMKNATASEYLVLDAQDRDTSGTTFCSYARAVYRVELSGAYEVSMELYTKYKFRTLNPSPTNVRLRLQFTADPYFNPVGKAAVSKPISSQISYIWVCT